MKITKSLVIGLAAVALAGVGCSKEQPPTKAIEESRAATDAEKQATEMGTAERLRMTQAPPMPGAMPGGTPGDVSSEAPAAQEFKWSVPKGWEEVPPTPMRAANLRLTANPEVEMYLTVLPGDGGGLLANINRWYKQMGEEELTEVQAKMLSNKMMLFKPAVFVNILGTFSGMGAEPKPDYALYGLAQINEGRAIFLKMTGPKAAAGAELGNFVGFAQSLAPANLDTAEMQLKAVPAMTLEAVPDAAPVEEAAPVADAAPVAEAAPAAPAAPAAAGGAIPPADALKWDAPGEWQQADARAMRVVTFNAGSSECYISLLGGMAGGLEANINRWSGQMGAEPLTPEQIAGLEQIEVLGAPCGLVDIEGDYQGMGGDKQSGYRLLGVVRAGEDQSLFVKMIGPKDEMAAQVEPFKAFVSSLR